MSRDWKVAILELDYGHDDCIYSLIRCLREPAREIHLVCHVKLRERTAHFDGIDGHYWADFGTTIAQQVRALAGVRSYLIDHHFDIAILNTARGSRVRNLLLLPLPEMEWIGTAHIANKLFEGTSRKLIARRVKKYLVLNDYIIPHVPLEPGLKVRGFYPVFFPPVNNPFVTKPDGQLWITIPGHVERKKRSYMTLIDQLDVKRLHPDVHFLILGHGSPSDPDVRAVRSALKDRDLESRFTLFDRFLDTQTFHSYVAQSDIILPLIHPREPGFEEYLKYKVSFAFYLAFGYGIPMLCNDAYEGIDDFDASCFYYSEDRLAERINQVAENQALLRDRARIMQSYPKFQLEHQRNRLLSLIQA